MSTPGALDNPGVRFPPPAIFLTGLVAAALVDQWLPTRLWPWEATSRALLGVPLVLGGGAWAVWGIRTFERAGTAVFPHQPASRLVRGGPYRFGRNPMYVGLSAIYWGVALWIDSLWGALFFPIVIALLIRFVVRREERYLRAAFGEAYARFCAEVPRWIGWPRAGRGNRRR